MSNANDMAFASRLDQFEIHTWIDRHAPDENRWGAARVSADRTSIRLVDTGSEVVRVKTTTYPANIWTTLTFMRPADEAISAQSFEITFNANDLKKFIEALTAAP